VETLMSMERCLYMYDFKVRFELNSFSQSTYSGP
jgi:hypothetical protein